MLSWPSLSKNKGDQTITHCGQLMSLFRRARLFASNQLVEDRVELATESAITDRLKDGLRRLNDSIEQHPHVHINDNTFGTLGAGKSRRLIGSTPFGCLAQEKWLPLHLISGGLILEFELDDADTAFAESAGSFEITDVNHTNVVDQKQSTKTDANVCNSLQQDSSLCWPSSFLRV